MERMESFEPLLTSTEEDRGQLWSRVIEHGPVTIFGMNITLTISTPIVACVFFSRDFRQAKLDLTSGRPVANPVIWSNVAVELEVTLLMIESFANDFYS